MRVIPVLAVLLILTNNASAKVVCKESDDQLVIKRQGKHVLSYQKTISIPEGVAKKYGRSGFIHPLSTPSGKIVTDGYPVPHHAHQHGLMFAWRKATFEGKKLNFWEPSPATVRHEKVLEIINEENRAGFRVQLAHVDGETKILNEVWTVLVDDTNGSIDFKSEQTCATKSPLTLDRFHYGGLALRGSRQWFVDAQKPGKKSDPNHKKNLPFQIMTDQKLTQANGNHSRPKWVCMAGPIDQKPVWVAVIPHPSNVRYPQHVRLHPKMPYFCFLPTVDKSFILKPGQPFLSRYRLLTNDGSPDAAYLNSIQRAFAKE